MKLVSIIVPFIIVLTLGVRAQTAQGGGERVAAEIIAAGSTQVVKGAPYSAEAVSESVQTLADGNKISRRHTTKMFRDSEGRTRREGSSNGGSGYSYTTGNGGLFNYFYQDSISIFDPVANHRFVLIPSSKTARRTTFGSGKAEGAVIVHGGQATTPSARALIEANAAQRANIVATPTLAAGSFVIHNGAGKSESLGTRSFEGVEAEGTRTVTTIPAGSIGNERDIEIVYERWYSKELQLIVYSKHSDPRFGEQTYRLVNINRSEPDRSLFAPPADYKIVSESGFGAYYNIVTTKPQQ